MPTPTKLEVAIKAVVRLVREEKSYHTELINQLARLDKTKEAASTASVNDNITYQMKQEETAIAQTRAVFMPLRLRIAAAVEKLVAEEEASKDGATQEQLDEAAAAIKQGREVMEKAAQDVQIVSA